MARKAKKKVHQMPPLSFVDQLIYWCAFLIVIALCLLLLFGPLYLRSQIAFFDEMVMAKEDHISLIWMIVPWMTFFLMGFILWIIPYESRRPIFGKRNFKYGPPAWPKVYPLFMKNKPYVWVSKRTIENRRKTTVILLVVLLVSFIPFPWSLYGRDCLLRDGSIHEYNMFNVEVREATSGQIVEVEFEAYAHRRGKHSVGKTWDVRVRLTTDDGRHYIFEYRDFRDSDIDAPPYWLTAMAQLRTRYSPHIITCTGTDNLYAVINDNNLNTEEANMLYQLFGISPRAYHTQGRFFMEKGRAVLNRVYRR